MAHRPCTIGSRSSKLAMVQAQLVRDELKAFYPGLDIEIKTIKTTGDKILDVAPLNTGTQNGAAITTDTSIHKTSSTKNTSTLGATKTQ